MYLHGRQRIDYNGDPEELVNQLKDIQELSSCKHIVPPLSPSMHPSFWKKLKVYFPAIFALLFLFAGALALTLSQHGQPKWTLYDDGVLTVSKGTLFTGKLPDYDNPFSDARVKNLPPWLNKNKDIKKAYIDDGISNVCPGMFLNCTNLEEVHMDSVTSIGAYAFFMCNNLSNITIPKSVTSIGEGAFAHSGIKRDSVVVLNNVDIGTNIFGE